MVQIDMVERQSRVPAACAARAPCTSPSRANSPAMPVGAIATGSASCSPSKVVATEICETSTSTRWRKRMASRSARLAASVSSS